MAKGSTRKRTKPKDGGRKPKKKISPLASENVAYIDYKDVELLKRFMSDRAKIRSRRVSGNDSQQQREVAQAIKNAREMALLPYTSRVTTQRRGGGGGGRGRDDRPPRSDGDRDSSSGGDSSEPRTEAPPAPPSGAETETAEA
jgi:small subunit ribosomal protein S18